MQIFDAIINIARPTSEKPITGMGIPLSVCNISDEPIMSDDTINASATLLTIVSVLAVNSFISL